MNDICVECGSKLFPLFSHYVCPNRCDKQPGGAQQRKANLQCFCGSTDVRDFLDCDEGNVACNPCGRIWFK